MPSLSIQVAPYIKKYSDHRFGHPIQITGKKSIHLFIKALLFQTCQAELFPDRQPFVRILPFTVQIVPPRNFEARAGLGHRLRMVNQLLETMFMEEMDRFISDKQIVYNRRKGDHNLKVQLGRFCETFGIVVDEDVTEDALVKMYYRYRKWISQPCEAGMPTAQTSFTAPAVFTSFG